MENFGTALKNSSKSVHCSPSILYVISGKTRQGSLGYGIKKQISTIDQTRSKDKICPYTVSSVWRRIPKISARTRVDVHLLSCPNSSRNLERSAKTLQQLEPVQ